MKREKPTPMLDATLRAFIRNGKPRPMTTADVATATGMDTHEAETVLRRMCCRGLAVPSRVSSVGVYDLTPKGLGACIA